MDRYPYALVWTPLPVITWLLPIIGHTGIADSEGIIHDFGASHYIAIDNFTFGQPTKYLTLEPRLAQTDWNEAIRIADSKFARTNHNLFSNNCHGHVAAALNAMRYNNRANYTQFDVFLMTLKAKYVNVGGFFKQWGVFLSVILVIIILILLSKLL